MLEQQPIQKCTSDELPMVTGQTIIPGPSESQKNDLLQLPPLKKEIEEFLSGPVIYSMIPDRTHISSKDLHHPLEIYFIEDTEDYWIRCCPGCIPHHNKSEALKLLNQLGITKENSEFSDSSCLDCTQALADSYPQPKEIQAETAESVEDVQK